MQSIKLKLLNSLANINSLSLKHAPHNEAFISIANQLEYIQLVLEGKEENLDKLNNISIGLLTARMLDEREDHQLCKDLHYISSFVKKELLGEIIELSRVDASGRGYHPRRPVDINKVIERYQEESEDNGMKM